MNKLNLKIKYCHDISSLFYQLDFSEKDFLLYATNVFMKTSLHNTIYEYKHSLKTHDIFFLLGFLFVKYLMNIIYPIPTNSIVVVGNDDYDFLNDNVTSILANSKLKKKYDKINNSLNKIIKVVNKYL